MFTGIELRVAGRQSVSLATHYRRSMFTGIKLRVALAALDFAERHPRFVRYFLRPLANAPLLSGLLPVLPRAYMGATAFEIHDVDVEKGRISIGGVDEVLFGSEIVEILHHVLGEAAGEEKERYLYEIGYQAGFKEATYALEKGRWAPKILVPLVTSAGLIDRVRCDNRMARFLDHVENMVARLILNEGGWGRIAEFDYRSRPIRVTLLYSQEAAWLPPSDQPVCHIFAGLVAGHVSAVSGERLEAREVACVAAGAEACVFEIDR